MTKKKFALIDEINEIPAIIRQFDPSQVKPWVEIINKTGKLLLTGEGSSRIFPAKNMIARALSASHPWRVHASGARQAMEYNLQDYCVVGASNSGQTRELVELFETLQTPKLGLTATIESRLVACSDHTLILSAGKEYATAATKTVIEQALVYQALLQGNEWKSQSKLADFCEQILTTPISNDIITTLSNASTLYFAGRDNGVAEELTLKTNEIIRKKSDYLEGTYAVHGIEEIMDTSDVLIVIDPFKAEFDKLEQVITKGVGMKIIAVSAHDTPFETIRTPICDGFDPYLQLVMGQHLLALTGLTLGIDLDKPIRARKVGNAL